MPFGLHNTGSTFKRMIDHVFAGLPFIFGSLGDVLVASPNHASHRCFARSFSRLCENSLTINTLKSIFSQEEVKILDLQVLASGLSLATCRLFPYPSSSSVSSGSSASTIGFSGAQWAFCSPNRHASGPWHQCALGSLL